jgi:hypothetical protein
MTAGNPLTDITVADLEGRHGHLEDFEPEPACAGLLTALVPIQRAYVFRDDPEP